LAYLEENADENVTFFGFWTHTQFKCTWLTYWFSQLPDPVK